jgi:hypothetical protein
MMIDDSAEKVDVEEEALGGGDIDTVHNNT